MKKLTGINLKIIFLVTIVFILVFSAIAFVIINRDFKANKDYLIERAQSFSYLSVGHIMNSHQVFFESGFFKFKELLKDIAALNNDLVRIQIINLRGEIVFDFDQKKEQKNILAATGPQERSRADASLVRRAKKLDATYEEIVVDGVRFYDVMQPYIGEWNRHDYSVRYLFSFSSLEEKLKKTILDVCIMAIAFFFIAIVLVSIFSKRVVIKPLRILTEGVKHIQKGDLGHKIEIDTQDEIGELANSFNKMTAELSKTIVSKEYIDNIVQTIVDPLVVIDDSLKITKVNQATLILLGYSEEELLGNSIKVLFEKDIALFKQVEWSEFLSQGVVRDYRTSYRNKTGNPVTISLSGSTMRDIKGNLLSVVFVAKDITEHEKVEEERKALLKVIDQNQKVVKELNDDLELCRKNMQKNAVEFSKIKKLAEDRGRNFEEMMRKIKQFNFMASGELKEALNAIETVSKFILDDCSDKLDAGGLKYLNQIKDNTEKIKILIEGSVSRFGMISID